MQEKNASFFILFLAMSIIPFVYGGFSCYYFFIIRASSSELYEPELKIAMNIMKLRHSERFEFSIWKMHKWGN